MTSAIAEKPAPEFDVIFSYASEDRATVNQVKEPRYKHAS